MKEKSGSKERRRYERAPVQTIVVGMLNSGESITVGSIADISLGGVKLTYHDLEMAPHESPVHSIDLMAGSLNLADIPCQYAWNVVLDTDSDPELTDLRQCGVEFGKLNPNQTFLLKSFIDHWASLRINNINSDEQITFS